MSIDAPPQRRHALGNLLVGAVVTVVTLLLLLADRTSTVTWVGLGLGAACLLAAAQRSSLPPGQSE